MVSVTQLRSQMQGHGSSSSLLIHPQKSDAEVGYKAGGENRIERLEFGSESYTELVNHNRNKIVLNSTVPQLNNQQSAYPYKQEG